jgi:ABC-2 type transport system ATP-binding protein
LLSILSGVRRVDRGTVDVVAPRSRIAVCPDVPEFEPWLTAYEVVDLARSYVAPEQNSDAVWRALVAAGLVDDADRRVGEFSRGMTQRLGLAAALVGDPELLVLDEPTSALDPAGRAEILDLVAAMRGQRTVIFSSHILADVQRVADHVGILRRGRLLYQGRTRALVDEHLTPSWVLRLGTPVVDVLAKLCAEPWVRRVERLDDERLRVDADTIEHGERGIPEVLVSCRARLVACEPLAADLEAAFLALTGQEDRT